MRGANKVGPKPADMVIAEKSLAKKVRRARARQPHELRILRDLLWRWLRDLELSDGEIALVCQYAARSRWTVGDRLRQLDRHIEAARARSQG